MNLTYDDVFAYLKEVQQSLQMKNDILNVDLHMKEQRKKLYSEGVLITYGDILQKCGLSRTDVVAHFHTLPDILNLINENARPIRLSALVVNKEALIPGNQYFERWQQSGHLDENEKIYLWSQDLKAIARN